MVNTVVRTALAAAALSAVTVAQPIPDVYAGDSERNSISARGVSAPGGGIRVAAGLGGSIDTSAVSAASNVYGGFDIRPNPGQAMSSGYVSSMAWTQESVGAAIMPASDGFMPNIKSGMVKSDAELSSAISVSAKLNGAFLGGAGKAAAAFGYDSSMSSQSHTVSAYTYGTAVLPGRQLAVLEALQLTPEAKGYLHTDVGRFLDVYGTHYIKARRYGCEASATYKFSCQTESAKQKISASIEGSYNGGSWSIGGSAATTYDKMQSSKLCTYHGNMAATGLNVVNPSQDQLMNAEIMDAYWNSFSKNCYDATSTDQPALIYVELGSWLDVAVVRTAVAGNKTAYDMLNFFGQLQQIDLHAVSVGIMLRDRVHQVVNNYKPGYAKPWATTGFFARVSGQAMSSVSKSYWDNLPTAHNDIVAKLEQSRLDQFFTPEAIMQAIASNTPVPTVITDFFTSARQLYKQAVKTYMYVHSGVRMTATTFALNNVDIISTTIEAPSTMYKDINLDNRMATTTLMAGGVPMVMTIYAGASNLGAGNTRIVTAVTIDDDYAQHVTYWSDPEQHESDNWNNVIDLYDVPGGIRERCDVCPQAKAETTVLYIMPDISFNPNPVSFM